MHAELLENIKFQRWACLQRWRHISNFSTVHVKCLIDLGVDFKTFPNENKITTLGSTTLECSPNLVLNVYHLIFTNKLKISLMWVLSYMSVIGNENADRQAAMGRLTAHWKFDIEIMQDLKAVKLKIKSHSDQLWNYGNKQRWLQLNYCRMWRFIIRPISSSGCFNTFRSTLEQTESCTVAPQNNRIISVSWLNVSSLDQTIISFDAWRWLFRSFQHCSLILVFLHDVGLYKSLVLYSDLYDHVLHISRYWAHLWHGCKTCCSSQLLQFWTWA